MVKYISMLIILLHFSGYFYNANCQNSVFIISDLDDTYKITNSAHFIPALFNIAFTKKSFVGNAELYKKISNDGKNLIILSKTPDIFRKRVIKLMEKDSIFPSEIILKKLKNNKDTYKVEAIKQILSQNPDYLLILIGDDVSHDHEVYAQILKDYPDKVLDIYIRQVIGRNLPSNEKLFSTSFDLAVYEYQADRLEIEDVEEIADCLLSNYENKLLKPHFVKSMIYPEFKNLPLKIEIKNQKIKILTCDSLITKKSAKN